MGARLLTSGELSQLGCAATDPPAQKFLQYKTDISAVKKMKAGELKDQLAVLPGAKYENMDQAKVMLIRHLESLYASTPTTCSTIAGASPTAHRRRLSHSLRKAPRRRLRPRSCMCCRCSRERA